MELDLTALTAPPLEEWTGAPAWLSLFGPDPGDAPAGSDDFAGLVPRASVVLERISEWGPSVDTLSVLASMDPEVLNPFDQVSFLVEVDAHVAWLEALRQRAVLAVAGAGPTAMDEGREEVACAIRLSPTTAQRRIDTARTLSWFAPVTQASLEGGRVSVLHASAVAETITSMLTAAGLDPYPPAGTEPDPAAVALAGRLEAAVFPRAAQQTLAELRRSLARAAARLQPVEHAAACERAARERRVSRYDLADGMIQLVADLPAADALTVWAALDTAARADGRNGLGVDAKRADALTAWAAAALADPTAPRRHGRPVTIGVRIDLPTLLGLRANPGELVGYGPIPAPVARMLAADADWRRLVAEPVTGHLLDYGRQTYAPPQELRDFLTARDLTCGQPGCHRDARFCQADHIRPWGQGGHTAACSMSMRCIRHHNLKTHHGWTYVRNEDGTTTFTTPTGHTYRTVLDDS